MNWGNWPGCEYSAAGGELDLTQLSAGAQLPSKASEETADVRPNVEAVEVDQ